LGLLLRLLSGKVPPGAGLFVTERVRLLAPRLLAIHASLQLLEKVPLESREAVVRAANAQLKKAHKLNQELLLDMVLIYTRPVTEDKDLWLYEVGRRIDPRNAHLAPRY